MIDMVISLPLAASGQPLSLTSTRVGFSQWGMSRTVTFTGRMTDSLLWSRHEVAHSDPEEKQSVRQLLDLVSWHPWAALRKCGLCHFLVPSGLGHPTLEGHGEEQTPQHNCFWSPRLYSLVSSPAGTHRHTHRP